MKTIIIDPLGEARRPQHRVSPRVADLNGKVLGMFDNSKPNFNIFLPEGAHPQAEPPGKTAGVDYRDAIELTWCLSNLPRRIKLFLKADVARAGGRAPSLVSFYKAADWQEREVFDLYGVRFDAHPNLSKILTPDFTVGHPLLKDYKHVKDRFD